MGDVMSRHLSLFVAAFIILLLFLASPADTLAVDNIELAGDILPFVLAATALGITAANPDGEGFLQYGKSATLSTGVTYALKYTVNEERPNGGDQSFPSVHTSFSFATAEFMRKRYGWGYGLPAYAAASFVGYSRVESDNHYWHDVIAGAAIGIASSYLFTESYQGVHLAAAAGQDFIGVRLSRNW
jgi:membrane-associated phospholipid phosphatase